MSTVKQHPEAPTEENTCSTTGYVPSNCDQADRTSLAYDIAMMRHINEPDPEHPEAPERISEVHFSGFWNVVLFQ